MLGRLVYEAENINSQSHTISDIYNQQVLIVKVAFENNYSSTKKSKLSYKHYNKKELRKLSGVLYL